jgi:hypothetical protein
MCIVCSTNDWVFRGEAGVLLGNRKQSGDEMCMDLQAFISLKTQLQTCLLLFSSGDASPFSVDLFPSRGGCYQIAIFLSLSYPGKNSQILCQREVVNCICFRFQCKLHSLWSSPLSLHVVPLAVIQYFSGSPGSTSCCFRVPKKWFLWLYKTIGFLKQPWVVTFKPWVVTMRNKY